MRTLAGLSKPLLNLDDEPIRQPSRVVGNKVVEGEKITVGSIIANSLARGSSNDPVRAMEVALKIHRAKGDIELEDADFALAERAVKEDTTINNMAKAAALAVLNGAKEAGKPAKAGKAT
jgi:hypothetical protein